MAAHRPRLVGVLGGMGPLATLDFLGKLLDATGAGSDQEHVPTVVWNVPQIPDRQQALAGGGEDPLPAMVQGIERLNAAGASCIAIPCNTAHAWFAPLQAASAVPILHIVDATVQALLRRNADGARIGLIATRGALDGQLYQPRLEAAGLDYVTNTPQELDTLFTPGCYAVKANDIERGGALIAQAARALLARGAQQLVMACTEIPIGLARAAPELLDRAIDPALALADSCILHWRGQAPGAPGAPGVPGVPGVPGGANMTLV